MQRLTTLLFIGILASCSIEKSMNNAEFDAVINKLGGNPSKNSIDENIMVGDAYRQSNRIVEALPYYQEVLKEGINGYILKKDSQNELISAVRAVKEDKLYLSSDINSMLIRGLNGAGEQKLLTDREREILKLIAKEFTNKSIAEELFISERTVETHRKNIFRKTGTNNLVGLIKYAYANNLI